MRRENANRQERQDRRERQDMSQNDLLLDDFKPKPRLSVKTTEVLTPRFPVIDAHNHLQAPFGGGWDKKPLAELLDILDTAQVRTYVDLDGGWGEDILNAHLDYFKAPAPDANYANFLNYQAFLAQQRH